jgi:hypothetical protein
VLAAINIQAFLRSAHFERDPIPYALETDWLAGVGGLELRNSETLGREKPSFNPEMLRQQKPDIPCRNDWTSAANRASVPAVDVALCLVSDPPPRWS